MNRRVASRRPVPRKRVGRRDRVIQTTYNVILVGKKEPFRNFLQAPSRLEIENAETEQRKICQWECRFEYAYTQHGL